MLFPQKHTHHPNSLHEPLLSEHKTSKKTNKPLPRLLNKRNSIIISNNSNNNSDINRNNNQLTEQSYQPIINKIPSLEYLDQQEPHNTVDITEEIINSTDDLAKELLLTKRDSVNNLSQTQKKSIKVQFNKKKKDKEELLINKNNNNNNIVNRNRQNIINNYNNSSNNINKSIYERFEEEGLRIKSNWTMPTKTKEKSFNSQIMSLDPRIQHFLYYMNLILNTVFRFALIAILVLMIVYEHEYELMEMIVAMEILTVFLYCLAMIKMLYTKKDEESIYLQKHFTDRDITDIEMDRVLRKHFTWNNILMNVSALFKMNSKFKTDIKISILRQEIFKRMEIVLCFIPFTVIFFTTPNTFRFECDCPVELIVTATICLEFVRMTVHYIVIFIEN